MDCEPIEPDILEKNQTDTPLATHTLCLEHPKPCDVGDVDISTHSVLPDSKVCVSHTPSLFV